MLDQDIESIQGAFLPIPCHGNYIPVRNNSEMISNLLQPKTAEEQYLVAQAAEAHDQLRELHWAK